MKPRQYGQDYASIFGDDSVVAVYHHRPPYHPETFPFLAGLIPPSVPERVVLDAGCGTGYVARPLAPLVDTLDAVDIAPVMVAEARNQPGGDRMDPAAARECDAALRAAVLPFCRDGRLPLSVSTRITWGLPLDPRLA